MTYALVAVIALMVVVYFWQERQIAAVRREHAKELKAERTGVDLIHIAHREQMAKMVADHREDVAKLCQRIQAPEAAIIEHQIDHGREGEAIIPLTDAEAAEREDAMRAAVAAIEDLEARERGESLLS